MVSSGANGATISLLSLGDELVELHVDYSGDGVIDEVITVTVHELSGQIGP